MDGLDLTLIFLEFWEFIYGIVEIKLGIEHPYSTYAAIVLIVTGALIISTITILILRACYNATLKPRK